MNYQKLKNEVKDILIYLINFYKNPSKSINKVPHWSWLSLLVLILLFGVVTGLFRGIFSANVLTAIVGMAFLPLSSYIAVFTISALLYFLVVIFQDRNLNFKRLSTLVFITLIPTLTTYVFSLIHPIFVLIGVTCSIILLLLGLQNRFQLNKNFIRITLGVLYGLFLTYWMIQYFNISTESERQLKLKELTIKSQKILEKEMSD